MFTYNKNINGLMPHVSAGYCQRALVDETGMIRTQMVKHNISVMVAMLGTPSAIPVLCGNSKRRKN
jgi:hypothetical protein